MVRKPISSGRVLWGCELKSRPETRAGRNRRHRRNLNLVYLAILILGVCSFLLLDRAIVSQKLESERAAVQRSLNSTKLRLEGLLDSYGHMSRSFAVAQSFEAESGFQSLARLLRDNNPSVINLARSRDFVITNVHPIEHNQDLLGYDYRTNPEQMQSVQAALDSGDTVVVGPVHLVQGGLGFLLRTAQPGLENIVSSIVLDFEKILTESGMEAEPQVYMSSARIKGVPGTDEEILFGMSEVWDNDPVITEVILGQTTLELAKIPSGGWQVDRSHHFILFLTIAILAGTGVFGVNYARRLILERAEARRRLLDAIESITDGFVIFDEQDRLLMCNDRFRKTFSASSDVISPGAPFQAILVDGVNKGLYEDAKGREEEWLADRMRLHNNPNGPSEIKLSNGSWIKVSDAKTRDGDTVSIQTDITELKTALQTAEDAVRSKTEFINNMNHELRAPLSVILGYIAFLRRLELYPQYTALRSAIGDDHKLEALLNEFCTVIVDQATKSENSGKHLLDLINSVLDWAKLSSGTVTLRLETVELDQLLVNLGEEFRSSAEGRGIRLEVVAAPLSIEVDPLRIRQVFTNLITNAIKFTDNGFVRVTLSTDARSVLVTVEDTGRGISEEERHWIFERFAQVDNSRPGSSGGTGLGLAITRNLVELHGGQISLTSTLGEGSKFQVNLPIDMLRPGKVAT